MHLICYIPYKEYILMAYLYTRACIKYSEVLFKTVTLKPGHINKFEYLKHQHPAMTKLNMSHIVHIFYLNYKLYW